MFVADPGPREVAFSATQLHALDRRTGDEEWSFRPDAGAVLGRPVADGSLVALPVGVRGADGSFDGGVSVLDARTGRPRTMITLVQEPTSVALLGTVVAVSTESGDGIVQGFDATSGEELWTQAGHRAGPGQSNSGYIAVERGPQHLGAARELVALAPTGETLWKHSLQEQEQILVASNDEHVLLEGIDRAGRRQLEALNAVNGARRWQTPIPFKSSSLALLKNVVVVGGGGSCEIQD